MAVNPYAAPSSELRSPPESPLGSRGIKVAIGSTYLISAGCIPAAGFAVWEIESIVISGGLLCLVSVVQFYFAIRNGFLQLAAFAAIMVVFVMSIAGTINAMSWSPTQAARPISIVCVVIAFLMQYGWLAARRTRAKLQSGLNATAEPQS